MLQSSETQTKPRVSTEYLRSILAKDAVSEQRLALLSFMLDARVDYRALLRLKSALFDKNQELGDVEKDDAISIESFIRERKHFLKEMSPEVEARILEDIAGPEEGTVSRKKLIELLDIYQFLPIRIKRDRNKSENVYYVLNSNKRGSPADRDQILENMKEMNAKMHLTKLMTLISIKLDEKFTQMAKAFLFFDVDGDQLITRTEFFKGIEGLRVKFSKADVDLVFNHLDTDDDKCLNYKEFCGLAEEKRRNIDPFDAEDNSDRFNRSSALKMANGASVVNVNPY